MAKKKLPLPPQKDYNFEMYGPLKKEKLLNLKPKNELSASCKNAATAHFARMLKTHTPTNATYDIYKASCNGFEVFFDGHRVCYFEKHGRAETFFLERGTLILKPNRLLGQFLVGLAQEFNLACPLMLSCGKFYWENVSVSQEDSRIQVGQLPVAFSNKPKF